MIAVTVEGMRLGAGCGHHGQANTVLGGTGAGSGTMVFNWMQLLCTFFACYCFLSPERMSVNKLPLGDTATLTRTVHSEMSDVASQCFAMVSQFIISYSKMCTQITLTLYTAGINVAVSPTWVLYTHRETKKYIENTCILKRIMISVNKDHFVQIAGIN